MSKQKSKGWTAGCLGRTIFSLLLVIAVIVGVIFFFSPDMSEKYFGMSWDSYQSGQNTSVEVEEELIAEELVGAITQSLKDAGIEQEKIDEMLLGFETEGLEDMLQQVSESGKEGASELSELIAQNLNLTDLNITIDKDMIKDQLQKNLQDIDFSAAAESLRNTMESGINSLKNIVNDTLNGEE